MTTYLEIWKASGRELITLESGPISIGKHASNQVSLPNDEEVSRLHAHLDHLPGGWVIRDLQSTNGTFINGQRLSGEKPLHPDDEIRVGSTRLFFRNDAPSDHTTTQSAEAPPELTPRERDVLIALCRPLLSGDLFTEPASIKEISEELVVTESAVKQHLGNLFDKFEIFQKDHRRSRLASESLRRGAVSIADLKDPPSSP